MEIKEFYGGGYMPLISHNGWRVAIANYCERLREENICKAERHLNTDEVFILLQGEATLFEGNDMKRYPMEIGKIYNIKCGIWHCIAMKENTKVAIVENDDTGDKNSEYRYFEKGELLNV